MIILEKILERLRERSTIITILTLFAVLFGWNVEEIEVLADSGEAIVLAGITVLGAVGVLTKEAPKE